MRNIIVWNMHNMSWFFVFKISLFWNFSACFWFRQVQFAIVFAMKMNKLYGATLQIPQKKNVGVARAKVGRTRVVKDGGGDSGDGDGGGAEKERWLVVDLHMCAPLYATV